MTKMMKTAAEIENLILAAISKVRECEGLTRVTIQPIEDDGIPFNWTINTPHNSPGRYCEIALETILIGMQQVIELKK